MAGVLLKALDRGSGKAKFGQWGRQRGVSVLVIGIPQAKAESQDENFQHWLVIWRSSEVNTSACGWLLGGSRKESVVDQVCNIVRFVVMLDVQVSFPD